MKLCLKIDVSWENPFNFWNENVKVIRRLMQKTTQSWKIHIPTSQESSQYVVYATLESQSYRILTIWKKIKATLKAKNPKKCKKING